MMNRFDDHPVVPAGPGRRGLLKGAVAAAPLATGVLSAGRARAAASTETYHIAVCDQTPGFNSILIHPRAAAWTPDTRVWSWAAPAVSGWNLLSDVKFRQSTAFGELVLATASGGNAGIIQMGTGKLLKTLSPGGNPHSIERIPGVDAIVVASSSEGPGHPKVTTASGKVLQGYLTIYSTDSSDRPDTLVEVDSFEFNGAHGLWFDGKYLWVIGADWLVRYACVGTGTAFRLADSGFRYPVEAGHSLDTDLSVPDRLIFSQGSYANALYKSSLSVFGWVPSMVGIKALSRVASGEQFLIRTPQATPWTSPTVDIYDATGLFLESKRLTGYGHDGQFYKARVSWTAFSG